MELRAGARVRVSVGVRVRISALCCASISSIMLKNSSMIVATHCALVASTYLTLVRGMREGICMRDLCITEIWTKYGQSLDGTHGILDGTRGEGTRQFL